MIGFIRRGVLADLVAQKEAPTPIEEGAEAQVLGVLAELGGEAAMADLVGATGLPRERLRRILQDLIAAGHLQRSGERADTRYVKVQR